MKWEYFYERYVSWPEDVLFSRIEDLDSAGDVDELLDAAGTINQEDINDSLVKRCILLGSVFSFDEILDFDSLVSETVLLDMADTAIKKRQPVNPDLIAEFDSSKDKALMAKLTEYALDQKVSFTAEQIENLDGIVPKILLSRAALESKKRFTENDLLELQYVIQDKALKELEDRYWPVRKERSKAGRAALLQAATVFGALSERKSSASPFRIGDHVRVKYRGQEGTVVDINGNLIMVALSDGHTDSYEASQLEKAW